MAMPTRVISAPEGATATKYDPRGRPRGRQRRAARSPRVERQLPASSAVSGTTRGSSSYQVSVFAAGPRRPACHRARPPGHAAAPVSGRRRSGAPTVAPSTPVTRGTAQTRTRSGRAVAPRPRSARSRPGCRRDGRGWGGRSLDLAVVAARTTSTPTASPTAAARRRGSATGDRWPVAWVLVHGRSASPWSSWCSGHRGIRRCPARARIVDKRRVGQFQQTNQFVFSDHRVPP